MSFRFAFRDGDGEEVRISSLEALARLVEDGSVTAATPLFDEFRGAWAPAESHPVFCLIREELGRSGAVPSPRDLPAGPVGELELAAPETPAEEVVRAFLEDRERERREDGMRSDGLIPDAPLSEGGSLPLPSGAPEPWWRPAAPPNPRPPLPPAPGARHPRRSRSGASAHPPRRRKLRAAYSGGEGARMTFLVILLLGVGGWGIVDAWTLPRELDAITVEHLPQLSPPRPAGPPSAGLREAQSAAFRDMQAGMEALREEMGVDEPPAVWMSGQYIARAWAYPEIPGYWERYRQLVDSLRSREEDLYLSGLEARLKSEGIDGSVLSVRFNRALMDFRADAARREARYAAMEELARAALDLHDFLVRSAGRIRHAPAETGDAGDPVLEAVPRDEETRRALLAGVDRLLAALDDVAGPDIERRRDVARAVLGDLASPPAS